MSMQRGRGWFFKFERTEGDLGEEEHRVGWHETPSGGLGFVPGKLLDGRFLHLGVKKWMGFFIRSLQSRARHLK